MDIYFAPMQGITDAPYRRAHRARFGGIAKYYTPFLSPTGERQLTHKALRDISPEHNAGLRVIPQILAAKPDPFLFAAHMLADLGWQEVNLNLGCPSGTVTAKGKGSGLLRDLDALALFLDEIYDKAPLPVSIKARIGWRDPEEFPALLELLNRYPIPELILHARTREDFYGGTPNRTAFAYAVRQARMPMVYNGDLFDLATCRRLAETLAPSAVMLGRGLAANPALARTLQGGAPLSQEELCAFHEDLLAIYTPAFGPAAALGRMRELGKNMLCCFENAREARKAIQKARTLDHYRDAMNRLFEHGTLRPDPGFIADGSKSGQAGLWMS